MYEKNYQQLGYAITLQAAKDYLSTRSQSTKNEILRYLRSERATLISSGLSPLLAEKLENEPEQVESRIFQFYRED